MSATVTKVRRISRALYVLIPEQIARGMRINHGDALALRAHGDEKLVLERIHLEKLAIIKSPLEATSR